MSIRVIPSALSDTDYDSPNFHDIRVFIGHCRIERIPLDTPIPVEAWDLAHQAYRAQFGPSRAWCREHHWPSGAAGICSEDAPGLWERARVAVDAVERKAA